MLDRVRVADFVARQYGLALPRVTLDIRRLDGGIEARGVARVRARLDHPDRVRHATFVVKHVSGDHELTTYRALQPLTAGVLAPRLLGADPAEGAGRYLYLEHVAATPRWPWGDHQMAGLVIDGLAELHTSVPTAGWPREWDYEAELRQMAEWTSADVHSAARRGQMPGGRHGVRVVDRFIGDFAAIRAVLLASDVVALHGDVHPGNVLVQRHGDSARVVLLDWGRARVGPALEDVASWLQSVGYWEREPQRRHDTLLRRYVAARGLAPVVTPDIRARYWLAAGCNAVAGALRYHLWVHAGGDTAGPERREAAGRAARDWVRVARRALAHWRTRPLTADTTY